MAEPSLSLGAVGEGMVAPQKGCPEDMTGADSACDHTSAAWNIELRFVTMAQEGVKLSGGRAAAGSMLSAGRLRQSDELFCLTNSAASTTERSLTLSRQSHSITCDPSFVTSAERRARV